MMKNSIGAFLSSLRKEKGYTQQEVADKLNISNKTVSKWECDDGYPEIMMLTAIADLYSVTVDEILRGERAKNEEKIISSETAMQTDNVSFENHSPREKSFEKAMRKFWNCSVIAVCLDGFTLFVTYIAVLLEYIISLGFIGFILVGVVLFSAIAVTAITVNNLKTTLKAEEADRKKLCVARRKINKLIICTAYFVCTSLMICVGGTNSNYIDPAIICIAVPIVNFVVFTFIYSIFFNRREVTENNGNVTALKRKYLKVTSIVTLIVVVMISFFTPLLIALANHSETSNGYSTDVYSEGKEYNKMKNIVENGGTVYEMVYMNPDTLQACVNEAFYTSVRNKEGYYVFRDEVENNIIKAFETSEELEQFADECISQEQVTFLTVQENIMFFGNNNGVKYSDVIGQNKKKSMYLELLPVTVVIGLNTGLVIISVSMIFYNRKKSLIACK